ncbi:BMC_2a_G0000830.mRNA.1.CDS.1 [Saccharomyces cerevisiae]|nr:BMB_G0000800.mRNA.1.CDS.1 [Saccharomyces cerevisiae]CAI4239220.1 BMC_2a_G0000830.mRNA.1.CDS.1 [Saccharomyces cerevisiae]CAI7035351.1 BMC_2a_G0000830.mRNA.1.CDS.1 [Saccharomyces cerevisiae]CAI7035518.1 BMB_G0000800.mRNA.1.CDS.1 [Saccharomyces cerevisiae]
MIMFLASVILISLTNFRTDNKASNIRLSLEVSTRQPSVKEEWRIITYKMNEYLFDHEIWSTPYYFYCEEDCRRLFLSFIEGRTFEKPTSNAEENTDRYFDQHNIFQHHNTAIEKTRYKLGMQTSSESTDAKSDSLDEPSAYLIEKNVALPKDIFGSYLSYWIYEAAHCTPAMILSLVIGVLVLLIIFFNDNEACLAFSVAFLLIFSVILVLVLILRFGPQISDEDFKCKLLMEIITRKPTVKGKEWRTITYKMNQYLFDNDLWNTPYYFYRDEDWHRYFQKHDVRNDKTISSVTISPVTMAIMSA